MGVHYYGGMFTIKEWCNPNADIFHQLVADNDVITGLTQFNLHRCRFFTHDLGFTCGQTSVFLS